MRLPWYQIDADGITRGRMLGHLLGVGQIAGVGMAIELWRWALELADEGDFEGKVPDMESVAAALGWPLEHVAKLQTELQRVGFIATTPDLRVRGLDRYRRTWEKNTRKKPKLLISGGRVPETGANPAPKTETETEKLKDLSQYRKEPHPPERKPRRLSAAEDFFEWLSATRSSKTQQTQQKPPVPKINSVFGRLLTQHGRSHLEPAYLAFLNDPDGASKEPPWPWESFAARAEHFVRRNQLRPAANHAQTQVFR